MVGRDAVARAGTSCAFGTTRVSGPGQNASARRSQRSSHRATTRFAASASMTCAMSGLSKGRPFSALKAMEKAIAVDPTIQSYHVRYADLLLKRARYQEAARQYDMALKIDPAAKTAPPLAVSK